MTKVQQPLWLVHLSCKRPPIRHPSLVLYRNVSAFAAQRDHTGTSPTQPPLKRAFLRFPEKVKPPLSLLPLPDLLRSYAITALCSSPLLLKPCLKILSILAHSSSPILNPDRNPLLHFLLKKTFYAQFCAGETTHEVQKTVQGLKNIGFQGVILAYGKEIVLERGEKLDDSPHNETSQRGDLETEAVKNVETWKEGILQTVSMTSAGDFVALKFSGAGRDAMRQLATNATPSKDIEEATTEICQFSQARGVRLLFDAEQDVVQRGIDAWTTKFQRRYNKGKAVVYGTYQAYLRSTPETLSNHLAVAQREGFVLGVKLVRGAYMASDPRELFWQKKEETDNVYNGILEALIKRQFNNILQPMDGSGANFPQVDFVLATHNQDSVRKAMALQAEQTRKNEPKDDLSYGQLMGMADEVSCELVLACNENKSLSIRENAKDVGPKTYKYLVWGSVGECLKYLVRRAEENREAVTRAKDSRMALCAELRRRMWR